MDSAVTGNQHRAIRAGDRQQAAIVGFDNHRLRALLFRRDAE